MFKPRSQEVVGGLERAGQRGLLHALGLTDEEFSKPFVGVVNSRSEINPGHVHLHTLANAVKLGVVSAGGTPFEINTIGLCDGIAQGHEGMRAILPSRDLIADSIEVATLANGFDALVLLASCDKVVPAVLMAAGRLDVPAIVVTGGPMMPGRHKGRELAVYEAREALGQHLKGEISAEELREIEVSVCPGPGSCSMMGTANSMSAVTEAVGMSVPGCATAHAVSSKKQALARQSGGQIMRLLKEDVRPSTVMSPKAVRNGITVAMAMGPSTNVVLHLLALARVLDQELELEEFDAISRRTPFICDIKPSGAHSLLALGIRLLVFVIVGFGFEVGGDLLQPSRHAPVHRVGGESAVVHALPSRLTCEDLNPLINGAHRIDVEFAVADGSTNSLSKHEVDDVVLWEDDTLSPRQPLSAACIEEALDLLVHASHRLNVSLLIHRSGHGDSLLQR